MHKKPPIIPKTSSFVLISIFFLAYKIQIMQSNYQAVMNFCDKISPNQSEADKTWAFLFDSFAQQTSENLFLIR